MKLLHYTCSFKARKARVTGTSEMSGDILICTNLRRQESYILGSESLLKFSLQQNDLTLIYKQHLEILHRQRNQFVEITFKGSDRIASYDLDGVCTVKATINFFIFTCVCCYNNTFLLYIYCVDSDNSTWMLLVLTSSDILPWNVPTAGNSARHNNSSNNTVFQSILSCRSVVLSCMRVSTFHVLYFKLM